MEKVVKLKSIMQILCVERVHRLPVELIDELPNATKPIDKSIMIKSSSLACLLISEMHPSY